MLNPTFPITEGRFLTQQFSVRTFIIQPKLSSGRFSVSANNNKIEKQTFSQWPSHERSSTKFLKGTRQVVQAHYEGVRLCAKMAWVILILWFRLKIVWAVASFTGSNFVNAHIILVKMPLCLEPFGAECYAFVTYSVIPNILNSIQVW